MTSGSGLITTSMMEGTSFENLFSNLLDKLEEEEKVVSVSRHFSPKHSVEDMFAFLWGLEEAHQTLTPKFLSAEKSQTMAEDWRTEGNKYYSKKKLDTALDLYNKSLMSAPHPEISNEEYRNEKICRVSDEEQEEHVNKSHFENCCAKGDEESFKSLALSYANRSAVLFELSQYEKCICDIDYALLYGYPKLLQSKLAERKAKCLISLGRRSEAKYLMEASLKALDKLPLDKEKTKLSRASLELLLQNSQQLDKTVAVPSKCNDSHQETKNKLIFSFEKSDPPQLDQQHPNIPSLSSSVELAFSPHQGRYLVANKNIKPGDVIAVEDPYSKIVHLDSSRYTHCTECLSRCLTPLPCPTCSEVIFCSTTCRRRALTSYHGPECDILASLAMLDVGKISVLACRIISQTTFINLRNRVPVYLSESAEKSSISLGFNDEGKYISSDYRTVYHLVGNKESRSVSDLFKRCAMAFVIVKLLERSSKFFVDAEGVFFTPNVEDIVLTGSTLFIHMMNLPCNGHSITEFQVNINCYEQSQHKEIGCGAFGVLSLTNHSCNPAAARYSFGGTVALKAVRFISAGTEVTDSYGMHYSIHNAKNRAANLLEQYYFKCVCEACKNQWPTYLGLSEDCKLKCVRCNHAIDCMRGMCLRCNLDYTKTYRSETLNVETFNLVNVMNQLKSLKAEYEDTYKLVLKGENSSEIINKICKFIEFIDRYIQQPCKAYFEAQETLKHCFDRKGFFILRCE